VKRYRDNAEGRRAAEALLRTDPPLAADTRGRVPRPIGDGRRFAVGSMAYSEVRVLGNIVPNHRRRTDFDKRRAVERIGPCAVAGHAGQGNSARHVAGVES